MSFAIDNEVKDRVRLAVNIVDLIGSYGEIRRQGRGFVAACPFHDDRRPSLQVNPDRQTWKCWVCDIGGDVFSFVMKKESVGFPEALRMLADRAGIVIENPKDRGSRDDKKRLYEAMKWATQEFHDCLLSSPEAKTAREYLEDRGITDGSLRKFQIGFAPESWSWLLDRGIAKSFSPDVLESIGLAARGDRGSRYDRFRNRAIFPIRDPSMEQLCSQVPYPAPAWHHTAGTKTKSRGLSFDQQCAKGRTTQVLHRTNRPWGLSAQSVRCRQQLIDHRPREVRDRHQLRILQSWLRLAWDMTE